MWTRLSWETTLCFHPHEEEKQWVVGAAAKRRTIDEVVTKLVSKVLHLYSVVENRGFWAMLPTLDGRYNFPSQPYLTDTAIDKLYNETKNKVTDSLEKAGRAAVLCDAWISTATKSYVTVIAHFITDEYERMLLLKDSWGINEQRGSCTTCRQQSGKISQIKALQREARQ